MRLTYGENFRTVGLCEAGRTDLIRKGHEGTFWGGGNVLYLDRVCICANPSNVGIQDLCISLYATLFLKIEL